jgi:transcriptional regulator with GAF, ATPase, and Fis domain
MAMVEEARDFESLRAELEARTRELQVKAGGGLDQSEEPRETPYEAHEPTSAAPSFSEAAGSEAFPTMEEVERDYILRVLEAKNWRVSGPRGAARILGLNASTLRSRMKKLGIIRDIRRKR